MPEHTSIEMFSLAAACAGGFVGGFASSAPLGPINLWIADRVLASAQRQLSGFVAGVIVADCAWAALAVVGYRLLEQSAAATAWGTALAGAALVVLGLLALRAQRAPASAAAPSAAAAAPSRAKPLGGFALGLAMCGGNPAFLVFWTLLIDLLALHLGVAIDASTFVAFVVGAAAGDGLWFVVLTRLAARGRDRAHPLLIRRARLGLAIGFIAMGLWAIYRGIDQGLVSRQNASSAAAASQPSGRDDTMESTPKIAMPTRADAPTDADRNAKFARRTAARPPRLVGALRIPRDRV